jgi:transposase
MSLPAFSTQAELFSTAALSASLFDQTDRYRLFGKLVYPCLAQVRSELAGGYCLENGRSAVEPVLMLGVSLLQYLEGVPDRQAVELLKDHAGWNFALNRQMGDGLFHSTTLVNFRQRLLEHELSPVGFRMVLEALIQAGLVARQSRQRLDSTQIFGRVSRMSRLDCVRETLRLALKELEGVVGAEARPRFWALQWVRPRGPRRQRRIIHDRSVPGSGGRAPGSVSGWADPDPVYPHDPGANGQSELSLRLDHSLRRLWSAPAMYRTPAEVSAAHRGRASHRLASPSPGATHGRLQATDETPPSH